jgi:hypothetical protein
MLDRWAACVRSTQAGAIDGALGGLAKMEEFNRPAPWNQSIGVRSMSTVTSTPSVAVYRMTVEEFERITDSLDDDQVELLDGYIVRRGEML